MLTAIIRFLQTYAEPISTLLYMLSTVVLASILGLLVYFRQKEYELVRKRYLEDGIDVLIHHVETALNIFQYNFTHSILVLKTFRELGVDMPARLYETGFQDLDRVTMVPTRNYLLQELIGDDVFYKLHQLMMVFVHDANNYFMNDLCSALRLKVKGGDKIHLKATRQQIVDVYMKHSIAFDKEALKYWILLGNLQKIAFAFEKERFTFKKIRKFRKNPSVKESIETLKSQFVKELKESEQEGELRGGVKITNKRFS